VALRSSRCLVAASAVAICFAVGSAFAADEDADGIDDRADDCIDVANPDQRDTDRDGFGNACDPDFDGDGAVGSADFVAVERAFGSRAGDPAYSADLDLDGDGRIGRRELLHVSRRFGAAPGPSGLECAGEPPCGVGLSVLEGAEEVLSRAVRLRWRAASPPPRFDVERRPAGGAWAVVGIASGSAREFVDLGPRGGGLAPGTWEYRVRGGGPWSEPLAVPLAEECAGQPSPSPSLPLVEIVDHEPDGDHDGEDVEAALRACSDLGGCVLRALPVVYDDVNVELAGATGYDFSRGLVVEGYGSASVFRSRVFSQRDHDPGLCPAGGPGPCFQPLPVWSMVQMGSVDLDGVRFRNFQIDGRKREQPDPGTPQVSWQHWGIAVKSPVLARTNRGCVHNVTARELMTGGFAVRHATGWILEHSRAIDLGCHDDFTPCDGLQRTEEYYGVPGLRSDAFGFLSEAETTGTVARHNRVLRATKYGIGAVFGARYFHFHDNAVRSVLGAGIECNGCRGGLIERNAVLSMHRPTGRNATWPDGYRGDLAQGIQCSGSVADLTVRDNVVAWGDGTGIQITCSGPRIAVERNAIAGNCRTHGDSLLVASSEDVSLLDNAIRDGAGRCQFSVSVSATRGARIEGGTIQSAPEALAGLFVVGSALRPTTGLVLRNLHFEGAGTRDAAIQLEPTSVGTTLYDSVCVAGYARAVVDRSADGALHLADPGRGCVP
jgi:hypothetical protein